MCLFIQTQIELNTKPVELILSRSKRAAEPCAQPEQQNQHHTLSDSVTGSSLRLPLLTVSVLVVLFKKERKKRRNYGVRIKLPFFSNSVLILGRDICLNPCRVQTTPGSVSGQRNRYKGNKPLRKKQFPLNLFFFCFVFVTVANTVFYWDFMPDQRTMEAQWQKIKIQTLTDWWKSPSCFADSLFLSVPFAKYIKFSHNFKFCQRF